MGILNDLAKQIYHASAGRIYWMSNMWAIVGSQWDKKRVQNKNAAGKGRFNEYGELIEHNHVLVKRQCTSNCPNPPKGIFFKGNDGKTWVPATECRKCPYYRGSSHAFRFPRCVFSKGKTLPEVAEATVQTLDKIMKAAVDKTKEIMQ